MGFYLFFKGFGFKQDDPLTLKARLIVRRQLVLAARQYIQNEQDALDVHNHVDLYFGGLDQRLPLPPKALKRRFLRQALKERPLKLRIADERRFLETRLSENRRPSPETTETLTMRPALHDAICIF